MATKFKLEGKRCMACFACVVACMDEKDIDSSKYTIKSVFHIEDNNLCDGCKDRVSHGLEPACIRVCPAKALSFKEK